MSKYFTEYLSYHLHSDNSPLLAMSTRKTFPTVKMMVNEINQIIDEQKTNELAWWQSDRKTPNTP